MWRRSSGIARLHRNAIQHLGIARQLSRTVENLVYEVVGVCAEGCRRRAPRAPRQRRLVSSRRSTQRDRGKRIVVGSSFHLPDRPALVVRRARPVERPHSSRQCRITGGCVARRLHGGTARIRLVASGLAHSSLCAGAVLVQVHLSGSLQPRWGMSVLAAAPQGWPLDQGVTCSVVGGLRHGLGSRGPLRVGYLGLLAHLLLTRLQR
mmetsp:Transcript_121935/g.352165  ORF Transcript_121935/g.352165 Transcript_121935/m.352165 type:complete len:207 (-) Transcript_121935:1594-2214(-)